jgi:hypothetical protein
MSIKTQASVEDLYHVPENGKAEIVNGELRLMSPNRRFAWQWSAPSRALLTHLRTTNRDRPRVWG